jgi:hypothetical protein
MLNLQEHNDLPVKLYRQMPFGGRPREMFVLGIENGPVLCVAECQSGEYQRETG